MNLVLRAGRYLFAVPMIIFGIFHFINVDALVGMVPSFLPAPTVLVYLAGVVLIVTGTCLVIRRYDRPAALVLAVLLLCFVAGIHLPAFLGGDPLALGPMMKDLALSGAALLYWDASDEV